jgi:hypothetical protein
MGRSRSPLTTSRSPLPTASQASKQRGCPLPVGTPSAAARVAGLAQEATATEASKQRGCPLPIITASAAARVAGLAQEATAPEPVTCRSSTSDSPGGNHIACLPPQHAPRASDPSGNQPRRRAA